jgi:unsaturated chondroitin disaccharide hydrolase
MTGLTHDSAQTQADDTWQRAVQSLRLGAQPVLDLIEAAPDGAVPRFSCLTGGYDLSPRYLPDEWATFQWVGFLCGRLWLLSDLLDDSRIRDAAHKLAHVVADGLATRPPRFSAAGCDLFYAVCLGVRITGDEMLAAKAETAVRHYAENFDHRVGVFFQVPGVNRAVVDTGMNLLPFYWVGDRDPALAALAIRHNTSMLDYGAVRPDGSTYHAVELDLETGRVQRRFNMQGYGDDTTWARGQAWVMHNYVTAYEASGVDRFLDVARRASRWYVDRLPSDNVPYYDFADPAAPAVPRDSCSASLAANALRRLARIDGDSSLWAEPAADAILAALVVDHLSPGGVLLHSSWGRLSAEKAGARLSRFPQEDVMPYGNYWVAEALYRAIQTDWSKLDFLRLRSAESI